MVDRHSFLSPVIRNHQTTAKLGLHTIYGCFGMMLNYRSQKGRHHTNTKHRELAGSGNETSRESEMGLVVKVAQRLSCSNVCIQCLKQKQSS